MLPTHFEVCNRCETDEMKRIEVVAILIETLRGKRFRLLYHFQFDFINLLEFGFLLTRKRSGVWIASKQSFLKYQKKTFFTIEFVNGFFDCWIKIDFVVFEKWPVFPIFAYWCWFWGRSSNLGSYDPPRTYKYPKVNWIISALVWIAPIFLHISKHIPVLDLNS